MHRGNQTSAATTRAPSESDKTFRGSGLLLGGRFIAIGLNFLVQILAIRYFLREEFGSFSFALSGVAFATSLNLMGLARTMSRLGSLYAERNDSRRLLGAIAASGGTIVVAGAMLVIALHVVHSVKVLFIPLATRFSERGETAELRSLYWAALRWIAILTAPIFAVITFLAPHIVPLLFLAVTLAAPPAWAAVVLVLAVIVVVWLGTRASLGLVETCPEITRLPVVGGVLA